MRWVGIAIIFFGVTNGLRSAVEAGRGFTSGSANDISSGAAGILISILVIMGGQYIMRRNPKIWVFSRIRG